MSQCQASRIWYLVSTLFPACVGMEHGSLSGLAGNVAVDWSLAPAHTLPNEEASLSVWELEKSSLLALCTGYRPSHGQSCGFRNGGGAHG